VIAGKEGHFNCHLSLQSGLLQKEAGAIARVRLSFFSLSSFSP
jgi:hypothetical protein